MAAATRHARRERAAWRKATEPVPRAMNTWSAGSCTTSSPRSSDSSSGLTGRRTSGRYERRVSRRGQWKWRHPGAGDGRPGVRAQALSRIPTVLDSGPHGCGSFLLCHARNACRFDRSRTQRQDAGSPAGAGRHTAVRARRTPKSAGRLLPSPIRRPTRNSKQRARQGGYRPRDPSARIAPGLPPCSATPSTSIRVPGLSAGQPDCSCRCRVRYSHQPRHAVSCWAVWGSRCRGAWRRVTSRAKAAACGFEKAGWNGDQGHPGTVGDLR